MQGAHREQECCLPPCCPGEGPPGALAVMVVLTHRSILALGHLLKDVQSIRWHIREQKAISAMGLLLVAAVIASSGLSASQTDFYSQLELLLVFFFHNAAIFMLGIICRIGCKDIDYHSIKFPRSESSCLFVFA